MSPISISRRCLVLGLACLPYSAWARRAEPLLLAQEAPPDIDPAGWLVSEKYDGVRALWTGRELRFRSGLPVAAPRAFTERLPAGVALDGELWLGRGRFEAVSGVVRRAEPDASAWRALRFMVFELPGGGGTFAERAARIEALVRQAGFAPFVAVKHEAVPDRDALQRRLAQVIAAGGEGLMLHKADAPYATGRSPLLLKLKPLHDAEAQVVAHQPGRGKHAGRLGALRVRTAAGVEFEIGTGFSDAQRESPPPVGQWITYTHRGHTAAGVPRFASYLRPR